MDEGSGSRSKYARCVFRAKKTAWALSLMPVMRAIAHPDGIVLSFSTDRNRNFHFLLVTSPENIVYFLCIVNSLTMLS